MRISPFECLPQGALHTWSNRTIFNNVTRARVNVNFTTFFYVQMIILWLISVAFAAPNVLVIVADDLGWNDIDAVFLGQTHFCTTNLRIW